MLSSIHPLGERSRGNSFNLTASAFVIGSIIGGALVGLILGAGGWMLRVAFTAAGSSIDQSTSLLAVAVVGVVALGYEASGRSIPSVHRQVNEDWLAEFRGWVYGIGFGFQLGAGITTFITAAAILVWLAAMVLAGSLNSAVLIGATFGLARGLSILPARAIDSPEQLVQFHRMLHRSAPRVQRLGSAVLVVVTVTAGILAGTVSP